MLDRPTDPGREALQPGSRVLRDPTLAGLSLGGAPPAGSAADDPAAPPPGTLRDRVPCVLQAVIGLATRLDRAAIRYCQFKSNRHLAEGLRGETDLDVLADRRGAFRLAAILADSGFKRFSAPPGGDYPGVEDYLAMDDATGRLVHLHLHYQLTTGEPHLKGWRIPWEESFLATRARDPRSGFAVADPNLEMLFLLTRSTLKIRARDRLRGRLGGDPLRAALDPEFRWLRERTDPQAVADLAVPRLGAPAAPAIARLMSEGPSLERLLALRRRAWGVLREYRTHHPTGALVRRWRRELRSLGSRFGRRVRPLAIAASRGDPRGGIMVALMGPDGAGKSRIAEEVARWLGWKLDARVIYFGSGDGPSSIGRWPLRLLLPIARATGLVRRVSAAPERDAGAADRNAGAGPRGDAPPSRLPARTALELPARALWALVLAGEKREGLRRAWRARNRGMIVICDRYPQDQVLGFNDGPLLHHWHRSRSRLARALARWELGPYRWARANPPDLVVKLRVSTEVAMRRKPEMRAEEIERRNRALGALRYGANTREIEVDADRPFEDVLLEIQREVWELL